MSSIFLPPSSRPEEPLLPERTETSSETLKQAEDPERNGKGFGLLDFFRSLYRKIVPPTPKIPERPLGDQARRLSFEVLTKEGWEDAHDAEKLELL